MSNINSVNNNIEISRKVHFHWLSQVFITLLYMVLFTNSVFGYTLDSIPVGSDPLGVAINPNTNRIYAANMYSNSVSVIDGSTNSIVSTIAVGDFPAGVAVNPNTNRVYVSK